MITNLSEDDARKFLGERSLARLGCVTDRGEPYVVPVNYFFRDDSIFIHSRPGLKIEALRKNPKACVQVDEIKSLFEWQSVIVFGDFEEITDADRRAQVLEILLKGFLALTPAEAVHHESDNSEIVLFRIRVRQITGRMEI
jgi:uncharacterized protein